MEDRFELKDKDGNVIAHKMMVEHLHVLFDEMEKDPDQEYVIHSTVTGYKLTVTSKTSLDEWREYAFQCAMALD